MGQLADLRIAVEDGPRALATGNPVEMDFDLLATVLESPAVPSPAEVYTSALLEGANAARAV
jgi:hypothetical protein